MGHAREQTEKLAAKLKQIREELNLSQGGMIKFLGMDNTLSREDISKFERGVREPPLRVILKYARATGISTDVLLDDEQDLPTLKD
jgi:transcriptional regulator with XRE-family HTH domain